MKLKRLDIGKAYETQGGQEFRLCSVKTMNDMKLKRLDVEKNYETKGGQGFRLHSVKTMYENLGDTG